MKKVNLIVASILLLGSVSSLSAESVVPKGDFAKKLKKVVGKQGKFVVGKDDFPKSYFLVHQNLPYLAGLSIHHPKSSILGLSKKQIEAIKEVKRKTVPYVIKKAQLIKSLELELAQNIAVDSNEAKSQYALVDKIGKLRIELTKAHLQCINNIRSILSKEQYSKLLGYATKIGSKPKSNKFKIDELVILPHPGQLIKKGLIDITQEQNKKITNEIKAVYAPFFQNKLREAYDLEKKVQRMVANGKGAKDVSTLIDKIMKLKAESILSRIEALNHIQKVLTKEQWVKANKLTYK